MKLEDALVIAERLKVDLARSCERIEIAGSIRRGKPEVKDIEIVAVPKDDLFEWSLALAVGDATFKKNGARYKQIILPEGINLDFFLVRPPAQWGVIFLLRTGPAEFSQRAVTQRSKGGLLPSDCKCQDGQIWRGDKVIPMPEEEDFLRLLGLEGFEPGGAWSMEGGGWRVKR